ncbi:MAG: sugar phosphate nucleotidyltransferase [Vampirovibrionia bacterium]
MKVIILCAGRGSRLGGITEYFPKSMITINHKPILGHILDHLYTGCSFKDSLDISIAVGYKSEIIKSYVNDFYPDKDISFVDVDKFEGISSGPGYSLLLMKDFVSNEPFLLILGDTLCFDDLANLIELGNCLCVYDVEDTSRFTTCLLSEENYVLDFYDKVQDAPSKAAIIGIYYIKDSGLYFEGLENTKDVLIKEELQLSNGFNHLLKNDIRIQAFYSSWKDTGIEDTLMFTRASMGDFNLYDNPAELSVIHPSKVRKYFLEEDYPDYKRYYSVIKKITKSSLYRTVEKESIKYPTFFDFNNFVDYKPLNSFIGPYCDTSHVMNVLFVILTRIKDNLYSNARFKHPGYDYLAYIISGLNSDSVLKEYFDSGIFVLNGDEYLFPSKILDNCDNSLLYQAYFVPIHGNLYLDNIFYDQKTNKVNLINPRLWFGDSFIYGDLAYDLACLMMSLAGLHNNIRLNNFTLSIDDDNAFSFELNNDIYYQLLKEKYLLLISRLFADEQLLNRVLFLESLLYFKISIRSNTLSQKLAYFFTGTILLNKIANCEFIAK